MAPPLTPSRGWMRPVRKRLLTTMLLARLLQLAIKSSRREHISSMAPDLNRKTWQMNKTSPADALAWLQGLPTISQTNRTVALLTAECLSASQEWKQLHESLESQFWAELEFIRHAFLSRALRGQNLAGAGKGE